MNKALFGILALLIAGSAWAVKVNPTSNVLGDTENSAGTLVLRDSNGVFDADSLLDASIVTAKLGTNSVISAKLYLDMPSSTVACITTAKIIGYCTDIGASGVCDSCW